MPTVSEMVAEAKRKVENLSVDEAAREIESGEALLVDVREPGERAKTGAIPGAVAVPRGMIEFWADPASPYHRDEFDPDRRIILQCAAGGRSALAACALQELGFSNVANLDGGINAWKAAGKPVEGGG